MRIILAFMLCLPLAAEDQPRFQRQAWLSEQENDRATRWQRQNPKLFRYLFENWNTGRIKNTDFTEKELEQLEAWRKEDDTLFAKLYGRAWPEAVEGQKRA